MTWHIEECVDRDCDGGCHTIVTECVECGALYEFEDTGQDYLGKCDCGTELEWPEGGLGDEREDFHADG